MKLRTIIDTELDRWIAHYREEQLAWIDNRIDNYREQGITRTREEIIEETLPEERHDDVRDWLADHLADFINDEHGIELPSAHWVAGADYVIAAAHLIDHDNTQEGLK